MKKRKALQIIFIWEITIIFIVCKELIIPLAIISFLYAIHYTRLRYLYMKKKNANKRKSNVRSRSKKDLSKTLEVRTPTKKSEITGSRNYVETDQELTPYERSLVGLPISLDEVNDITGEDFENILFNRFKSMDFIVYYTPTSGDFGADLIIDLENTSVVVQIKRYNYKQGRTVGVKAVQEVLGAIIYYKADRGMVITNATYTNAARELAKSAKNIVLWDREDLKKNLNFY